MKGSQRPQIKVTVEPQGFKKTEGEEKEKNSRNARNRKRHPCRVAGLPTKGWRSNEQSDHRLNNMRY